MAAHTVFAFPRRTV